MLLKPLEWLEKVNNLKRPHKGTVKDNMDPLMLGRLKIKVEKMFEDSDPEKLPWVYPANATGLGGTKDASGFVVPEIESEVTVEFPFDDIYFPFYTSYWQSSLNHQKDFDQDYPETYGWRDKTFNRFKINKKAKFIEFVHSSGTKIQINKDGDLMLDIVGGLHIKVAKDIHVKSVLGKYEDSQVIHHNSGLANPIYDPPTEPDAAKEE